ncbi:hypothetical protein Tco_0602286 [Tanacetum coccineum]
MCIFLNDHLDAAERIHHISSLEGELDIEQDLHDVDVEAGFAISLSDEESLWMKLLARLVITEYLVNISKRRAFWSLNEYILKITILTTNTPYPSRKIRRIRACTHQRPQRKQVQYAVSSEAQYAVLEVMDDPNITMEEYARLEEEKARKRDKVFNWETAKYGKIWYDEDIHDLISVETEFSAIAFNDGVSSKTLSCEPTVSSLNDEIDSRISFDDSDDEDYTSEKDNDDNEVDIIQSSRGNEITQGTGCEGQDMALPPRNQRHQYLRYEGLQYSDADIVDFEARLARIYRTEVHRVQVFDFEGLPDLMVDGLSARMLMEHRDAQGVSLFTSQAWRLLFDIRGPLVHELILEFFSTFRFGEAILDLDTAWSSTVSIGISSAGDFLGIAPSYTVIMDPILRLCHRLIDCSIAGRSQAPEKVTVTDLFYLRGMDVGSVNVPYLLAMYLRLFTARRKIGVLISGGQFVARLAKHFGLLTEERLRGLTVITPALPVIDMTELVRLQICMEINDTWAWVAQGPKRQPDAAAGAHKAVEDALAVDDDMPQAGQSEVLDYMTRDFSKFATWTVTSLARMMDIAGLAYTSYSETPDEYQRCTRQRTGKASTSTAQQDPQQPDP